MRGHKILVNLGHKYFSGKKVKTKDGKKFFLSGSWVKTLFDVKKLSMQTHYEINNFFE